MGRYTACTDADGLAILSLPAGSYTLDIRKMGYTSESKALDVLKDTEVQLELAAASERDPHDPYPEGWWG